MRMPFHLWRVIVVAVNVQVIYSWHSFVPKLLILHLVQQPPRQLFEFFFSFAQRNKFRRTSRPFGVFEYFFFTWKTLVVASPLIGIIATKKKRKKRKCGFSSIVFSQVFSVRLCADCVNWSNSHWKILLWSRSEEQNACIVLCSVVVYRISILFSFQVTFLAEDSFCACSVFSCCSWLLCTKIALTAPAGS